MEKSRAIYFLANDRVLDLAIAFLNSLKSRNISCDICLIPFDDQTQNLLALQSKFGFKVFDDPELFASCDKISISFHSYVVGNYRKLAAWQGPYEEFIYIDIDTIVLENPEFVFQFLNEYEVVVSHSNMPTIRKFVWKDSILGLKDILTKEQIDFSANTGFIASKKDIFNPFRILKNIDPILKLKEYMELNCAEQPLLNYLIVTSNIKYSSLFLLRYQRSLLQIPLEYWAGITNGKIEGDMIKFEGLDKPLLIHWAGLWKDHNKSTSSVSVVSKEMPYRKLWEEYRYKAETDTNPQEIIEME